MNDILIRDVPDDVRLPVEYLTLRIEDRAVAIQLALADLGQHRTPSIPDLLIAATAENQKNPGFNDPRFLIVELRRIELLTSSMPWKRSTN